MIVNSSAAAVFPIHLTLFFKPNYILGKEKYASNFSSEVSFVQIIVVDAFDDHSTGKEFRSKYN